MAEKKYRIIEDFIIRQINEKKYKTGEQIPTEEQLCKQFNFSRMTVNKALSHLSEMGYITRSPKKGSFVSIPAVHKATTQRQSFSEDMRKIGLTPGSKLISYSLIRASEKPDIRDKLSLNDTDYLHYFVRLRTGDDIPVAVSYTYVAVSVVPAIDISSLESSFYAYLDKIGITRDAMNMEIKAVLPDKEKKELLQIDEAALLCSSHVSYTKKDHLFIPFEYIETYYNGNIYTYSTEN